MFCLHQERCQQRNLKQGYDCGQHQHLAKVPKILDFFNIEINSETLMPRIWLPDLEIMDLMSFQTHKILSKLEGDKRT